MSPAHYLSKPGGGGGGGGGRIQGPGPAAPPGFTQPSLPSQFLALRLLVIVPFGSECCSLSSLAWARDKAFMAQGFSRRVMLHYDLRLGRGLVLRGGGFLVNCLSCNIF